MLSNETQHKVEQLILDNNIVDAHAMDLARIEGAKVGKSAIDILIEQKLLKEEDAVKLTAIASHVPYVDLTNQQIPEEVLRLVPRDVSQRYMAVPIGMVDGRLNLAMVDPQDLQAIDFISKKTGYNVTPFMASHRQIEKIIGGYVANLGAEVAKELDTAQEQQATVEGQKIDKETSKKVETLVQDAPITRALNAVFEYAINSKASDIHIEPREHELKIRFRVDGILQEAMTLPKSTEAALISRIKIMSKLKIDEHRIPQDGQAMYKINGREVDLRIAIAPLTYGEQVVIRILDKNDQMISLDTLGFRGQAYRLIKNGMNKPHGMILSTGPTGSGKSTTLYAVIQEIKSVKINIVTLEDPVEYKMDGINQIQVNSSVGLTFASGLRSILRQDPNVIMVGEIRDHETADLAVQAALTGHIVLSTLHTNSASGVLPRLLDMGMEPFLVASTINTVIGQRLVRRVCDKCRKPFASTDSATQMINQSLGYVLPKNEADRAKIENWVGYEGLPLYNENAYTLYKGEGCDECTDGYKGRVGIFEVFEMNPAMEHLLVSHATTAQIQEQAMKDGMLTMKQDGLLKALTGATTIEEVARVASDY